MIGTINCIYETPCGWCTKWDKQCDKKMASNTNRPCPHCVHHERNVQLCHDCDTTNNFQHFQAKDRRQTQA